MYAPYIYICPHSRRSLLTVRYLTSTLEQYLRALLHQASNPTHPANVPLLTYRAACGGCSQRATTCRPRCLPLRSMWTRPASNPHPNPNPSRNPSPSPNAHPAPNQARTARDRPAMCMAGPSPPWPMQPLPRLSSRPARNPYPSPSPSPSPRPSGNHTATVTPQAAGRWGLTTRLECNYREMLPL
jgi:hypothetical protein